MDYVCIYLFNNLYDRIRSIIITGSHHWVSSWTRVLLAASAVHINA